MTDLEIYSAYLPYEVEMAFLKSGRVITLKGLWYNENGNLNFVSITGESFLQKNWDFKIILRPLSDLLKSDLDFGEYNNEFRNEFIQDIKFKTNSYGSMVKLLKNHFDVFGLIEQGKAIDINTL